MEAKPLKSVYFVDANSGKAGLVSTTEDTIGGFLASQMGTGFNPDKYLIRHGGKCPEGPQQQIQDGDTISVTLTKIEGHCG